MRQHAKRWRAPAHERGREGCTHSSGTRCRRLDSSPARQRGIHQRHRALVPVAGRLSPEQLRAMPAVLARVEGVRKQRRDSTRPTTRTLADTPTLFGEIRQPAGDYFAIPEVSSERRMFIPIGFLPQTVVATNKLYTIGGAELHSFGIVTSTMHMAWTRAVCGRLESRYQYSAGIV